MAYFWNLARRFWNEGLNYSSSVTQRMGDPPFVPALIVVDVQNDFITGSLAVPNGADVIEPINELLNLPFPLKVGTADWHPPDHISFASQHKGAKPYTSTTTIVNPSNEHESFESTLWPDHCVKNTRGAEFHPKLNTSKFDKVIRKGKDQSIEQYSAFYPPLINPRVSDSGLSTLLKNHHITDVFVVGLAADYCVSSTAMDSVREGYMTYIIDEATRAVDKGKWEEEKHTCQGEIRPGVKLVHLAGPDLERIRGLPARKEKGRTTGALDHEEWNKGLKVADLPVAK